MLCLSIVIISQHSVFQCPLNDIQDQLKFLNTTINKLFFFFPLSENFELEATFWKQICPQVFQIQTRQILGVVVALLTEI